MAAGWSHSLCLPVALESPYAGKQMTFENLNSAFLQQQQSNLHTMFEKQKLVQHLGHIKYLNDQNVPLFICIHPFSNNKSFHSAYAWSQNINDRYEYMNWTHLQTIIKSEGPTWFNVWTHNHRQFFLCMLKHGKNVLSSWIYSDRLTVAVTSQRWSAMPMCNYSRP